MNVRYVIDRLVQLQATLLAELATSGGARAPLAELADQTFIHLAEELDRRGISRKVSADMFGMALRAYLKKLQRLAQSSTESGTSLWQAVVDYLDKHEEATRAQILQRFCRDDEAQLRAVLYDLGESGLTSCSGSGPQAVYRLARLESSKLVDSATFAELVWLTIFREGPLNEEQLLARSPQRREQWEQALSHLAETGRIVVSQQGEARIFESNRFEITVSDGGWEAAILDHYQAMVQTIVGVLPGLVSSAPAQSAIGGYTYSLDVWPGHPYEEEVRSTLSELRTKLSALRKRVDSYNEGHTLPGSYSEYRIYGGQFVSERSTRPSMVPAKMKQEEPLSEPPPAYGGDPVQ